MKTECFACGNRYEDRAFASDPPKECEKCKVLKEKLGEEAFQQLLAIIENRIAEYHYIDPDDS